MVQEYWQEYWVVTLNPPETLLDEWYGLKEAFPHTDSFTIPQAQGALRKKYPGLDLNMEQVTNIIENLEHQRAVAKESPEADWDRPRVNVREE